MVSSKKPNRARSKGLSQRLKEDGISQLPDSLICQILSHLPTKDSVQTSVLSTRWKTLWLWVPSLKLQFGGLYDDNGDFPDSNTFMIFGDRFFDSNRVSWLHKVNLRIIELADDVISAPYFTSWIDVAIKRKVQHLDVYCPDVFVYWMPESLYVCQTLVSLKLYEVALPSFKFFSLPCLKTMQLGSIMFPNATTFRRFVSCCPVLEDLEISECGIDFNIMWVYSLSLKSIKLNLRDNDYGVVIDAPLLRCLTIDDKESQGYVIKNMGPDVKMDIYLTFGLREFDEAGVLSRRIEIRSFLSGISNVRDMKIYSNILEIFCQYSKLEPLPQFSCMSRLYADIYEPDLKWLLPFLGSCPNLKSLILFWEGDVEEMDDMSSSYVPECLVSSLEYVDIESSISGYDAEMKLVRYFLENSVNLKKLTMRLDYRKNVNVIFKKLLEIPRRSSTCEVVVVDTLGAERYNMIWSLLFPHELCI